MTVKAMKTFGVMIMIIIRGGSCLSR